MTPSMSNLLRTAKRRRPATLAALALILSSALLATPRAAFSQTSTGRVVVRVTVDSLPIVGATVASGTANGATDRSGFATFNLPTGRRTFRVTSAGFHPESLAFNVGIGMTRLNVALQREGALPVVSAAAMRDVRRGADEATNVEVTDRFAMDEQIDRSPGSVSGLLNHVDGVRVQPLSAGSAGAGIRVRGMPATIRKFSPTVCRSSARRPKAGAAPDAGTRRRARRSHQGRFVRARTDRARSAASSTSFPRRRRRRQSCS